MGEAVEQRGGHLGIAEDAGPLREGQVGGDDQAGVFVELADQVEEQGAAGLAEGQVAQFVELCGAPHKSINVESSVMWSSKDNRL